MFAGAGPLVRAAPARVCYERRARARIFATFAACAKCLDEAALDCLAALRPRPPGRAGTSVPDNTGAKW